MMGGRGFYQIFQEPVILFYPNSCRDYDGYCKLVWRGEPQRPITKARASETVARDLRPIFTH